MQTVDTTGKASPGRSLSYVLNRIEWRAKPGMTSQGGKGIGGWDEIDTPVMTGTLTTAADGSARLAFTPQAGRIIPARHRGP